MDIFWQDFPAHRCRPSWNNRCLHMPTWRCNSRLREGSVRVGYPTALREFSEIFDYLRDRGQKLVEEKEKLKDMGLMDHLSQLGNRRHFEARLKELFDASKANGPSSMLII